MKTIIPKRIIIELNDDNTFKDAILQYQIDIDGSVDTRKCYTMGLKNGLKLSKLTEHLNDAKAHAEKGEGINV